MIASDTPAQDMPMRKRVLVAVAAAVVFFAAAGALLIQGYHQAFDALGQWQLKSADAGDPEAQVGLGLSYRNGFGVPTDEAKAVELFRKAAEQGSAAGRFRLGESFEKGRGVSRDTSQAVEWYRQAAEQGSPQARGALRRMYVRGQLVPQIDARAGNWWRKFAEDADSEAKAFARLRLSAEGGDADAQTNLGLSYLTGTGTLKDREKAAEWFGRAGEQGYLRAKCLYAALKASDADWGPRSNGARAAETCRAAADAGDADAQRILGMLYATGSGVRKNFVESAAWTRKAAEQGRADAQYDLGYKYEKGEGVPKDKAQACAWNERAAQQGYPDALSSAAMEAMMASLDGDRCQRRGTADATALLNSSIEYSSENERRLFPNLWYSPLNRANQQQSTDSQESIGSMMMFGMSLGLFMLAIPFVTGLVAAWAWAARGIAISAVGGLLVALVIAFLPFRGEAAYPLYAAGGRAGLIFLVWLIASVPAVIIGLAVRSIARRTAD